MSTFHALAEHLHLLKTSCSLVLKDEGFQLPTPLAEKALKSAERLLEWLSDAENKEAASIFASNFIGSLIQLLFDLSYSTIWKRANVGTLLQVALIRKICD